MVRYKGETWGNAGNAECISSKFDVKKKKKKKDLSQILMCGGGFFFCKYDGWETSIWSGENSQRV